MLVVSSCSEHRFICRRQRGAPSQLTAGAAVCGRVVGWGQYNPIYTKLDIKSFSIVNNHG